MSGCSVNCDSVIMTILHYLCVLNPSMLGSLMPIAITINPSVLYMVNLVHLFRIGEKGPLTCHEYYKLAWINRQ